jgi:hypothetical protein
MQDFESAIGIFGDSRATFNEIASIHIKYAVYISDCCMVDMPANDAVHASAPRLGRKSRLEITDEVDGILDPVFDPGRN